MKAWLDSAPANTAATAYTVKLNMSSLGGDSYTAGSAGNALYNNRATKYVSLDLSGSTLTSIGMVAFYECSSLTSVTIPATVTRIGSSAFGNCTSLISVTFASGSNIANANFGGSAFPEGSTGAGGNTLKTAYSTGKAGTYTRAANGTTWTKQP